jgi:hypothetical protein
VHAPFNTMEVTPCLRQYLELLHVREANAVLKDKCSKCVICGQPGDAHLTR